MIAPRGGDNALQRPDVVGTLVFTPGSLLMRFALPSVVVSRPYGGERKVAYRAGCTCAKAWAIGCNLHQQLCDLRFNIFQKVCTIEQNRKMWTAIVLSSRLNCRSCGFVLFWEWSDLSYSANWDDISRSLSRRFTIYDAFAVFPEFDADAADSYFDC